MKELTVEEKAQRFDEAIEKIKKLVSCGLIYEDAAIQVFPELEESRNEKIRQWLIEMVEELRKANPTNADHNGMCSEARAWLENQQDNNEDSNILQRFSFYSYKDEPNILYLSGLYVNEEYRNKGIGTKILEVADEIAKSLNCQAIRLKTKKDSNAERLYRMHEYNSLAAEEKDEIWLEKQSGQKSANEVSPDPYKSEDERIKEEIITYLSTVDDKELIPYESWINWIEEQGDHANFRNKIQIGDKVTRNKDGVLVNLSQLDRVAKKPEPEKKNPWSSEDEKIARALISMCTEWLKSFPENKDIETMKIWLSELKERVYPPQEKDWSDKDEDKQHLTNLLAILEDHGYREADVLNRIKKQDWSEIDERILKKVITLLKMFKREPSEKLRKEYQKEIDWLNLKISKLGGAFEVKNKIS